MQEVEKQYKEGSLKHIMAAVLKAVQPEALNVQGASAACCVFAFWCCCWLKALLASGAVIKAVQHDALIAPCGFGCS